jgi:hypothetical protein
VFLPVADIWKGLKSKVFQNAFTVQQHGYGWTVCATGDPEEGAPAINDYLGRILDNPEEFCPGGRPQRGPSNPIRVTTLGATT